MSEPIVYVVDDDRDVREGLEMLFDSVGLAVASFASADEFLDACEPDRTCCLLLDMRLPETDGLECQARLERHGFDMPVVFLTGHGDVSSAVHAIRRGAIDFLEKPLEPGVLLERVQECLRIHARKRNDMARRQRIESRFAELTAREREIVDLVAAGKSNKVIAIELDISERTVEVHRSRAFHKLEVRNVAQLVQAKLARGRASGLPDRRTRR